MPVSLAVDTDRAGSMTTVTFDAPGLGDRSYLISDGEKAVVVDPQRDMSPYLDEALKLGVDVSAVLETHIHNDYVSGGLALATGDGCDLRHPRGRARVVLRRVPRPRRR